MLDSTEGREKKEFIMAYLIPSSPNHIIYHIYPSIFLYVFLAVLYIFVKSLFFSDLFSVLIVQLHMYYIHMAEITQDGSIPISFL
jgi:hypothetical protein